MTVAIVGIAATFITTASIASAVTASHDVTYSVVPTRTLTLSSNTVDAGPIGKSTTVNNIDGGSIFYSSDVSGDKVTVASSAMEANTSLKVTAGSIAECTGGTKGTLQTMPITLSATPQDLITGIGPTGTGNCASSLTYAITTTGAAIASSVSKTVTYTIQAA